MDTTPMPEMPKTLMKRMVNVIADSAAAGLAAVLHELIVGVPLLRAKFILIQERRLAERFSRLMTSQPPPAAMKWAAQAQCGPDCPECAAERKRTWGQA